MSFEQSPIWQQLLLAKQRQHLHHALLLSGSQQGKERFALAFAKYLLCANPQDDTACGHCQSCHFFDEDYHPDLCVLGKDVETRVKIDDIREVIQFLSQSPHTAQVKIVVICHAHLLNVASQNALLKILEEPPQSVHFILTSAKPHLLLPTIKSRCLSYVFKSMTQKQVLENLKTAIQQQSELSALTRYSEQELQALLYLADGNIEEVLTWSQSPIWEHRNALIGEFILGNLQHNTNLQSHMVRHAEHALYFIYLALSEWIRQQMSSVPVNSYILNREYTKRPQLDLQPYFEYLYHIEQAIQSVAQVPGINKLLLFQSLLVKRKAIIAVS
tara:strand:- start:225030 stop:226019 length:990 start_codon:yes stop_codon:yes gene_type:complete